LLNGHTILCFGYSTWDFVRTDRILLEHFAPNNRCVYVEAQGPYQGQLRNAWRQVLTAPVCEAVYGDGNGMLVLPAPPLLAGVKGEVDLIPRFVTPTLARLSESMLGRYISKAAALYDLRPTMLWLWHPFHSWLLRRWPDTASCYLIYDELHLFPQNAPIARLLSRCDEKLCQAADVVVTSSASQYARRKTLGNVHLLTNGCDFDLHVKAREPGPTPAELEGLPRPIIGFIGHLDFRVDVNLLVAIARLRPDWSLAIIGRIRETAPALTKLKSCRNVLLVDAVPPGRVPDYNRAIDVAVIPYRITAATSAMFPMKVYEHLAAGMPVVATHLPELAALGDLISIASDARSFVEAIERELAANDAAKVSRRVAAAKANSWSAKAEALSQILEAEALLVRPE